MARWGMVIDLRRCRGYRACVGACSIENCVPVDYTSPDAGEQMLMWARGEVDYYNIRVLNIFSDGRVLTLPANCMHCDKPRCVEACPTTASYKRPDGIVAIDHTKCIGCKSCIAVCPYGARYIRAIGSTRGVADKCQFCYHLVDKGEPPRCAQACPTKAIAFGDLDDPKSEVRRLLASVDPSKVKVLKPEAGTAPKVSYVFP